MKRVATLINLKDIIITKRFLSTKPSEIKYNKKKSYIEQSGKYKIILNENNELIDGYISYLVLKEIGYTDVYVERIVNNKDLKEETYVYGYHPNSVSNKKEYVWRLTNRVKSKIGDITEGMMLMVVAKEKIAPMIVTKIETRDNPPVSGIIKNVVGVPRYEQV